MNVHLRMVILEENQDQTALFPGKKLIKPVFLKSNS